MENEKSAGSGFETDLLGDPVRELRDRRGRKSLLRDKNFKQYQQAVEVRAAEGWAHERIAESLGIDAKTLRKYFSRELQHGRTYLVGELLDTLRRKAREGHVPSARLLLERIEAGAPVAPRKRPTEEDEEDDLPAPQLGKKELRDIEAQQVPDDYGDIFDRLRRH